VPHSLRQQSLSLALERATLTDLLGPAVSVSRRAHLRLELAPNAGAWLNAMPSSAIGCHVNPLLYGVMLRRRLRVPLFDRSFHCPYCDGVMDPYGDHALACGGGGDRTIRHNALRNVAFRLCMAAGLRPELEKPALLRPRPWVGNAEEDGRRREGSRGADGRRPADIFLPCWRAGCPAALDFAVTSGLRIGALSLSAVDGASNAESYASFKRHHLDTGTHCSDEGIDFVPMIVEASGGGWGSDARRVWHELGRAASRLSGDPAAAKSEHFLQTLSITLHRANARAILRRAPTPNAALPAFAAAQAVLAGASADRAAESMSLGQ
jgi:hypothetical protein